MNTYEWRVIAMDVRPAESGYDNVVVGVDYEILVHDPVVGDTAGTQMKARCGPIDSSEFIDYANLTEEEVLTWVRATLTDSVIAEIYAFLDTLLINNRKPPITQLPLPWA